METHNLVHRRLKRHLIRRFTLVDCIGKRIGPYILSIVRREKARGSLWLWIESLQLRSLLYTINREAFSSRALTW